MPPLPLGLIFLLLSSIGLMVAISFVDYSWTLYIIEHRSKSFAELMQRNLMENGQFGGSDPVLVLLIMIIAAYFYANRSQASETWQKYRPILGYLITTFLISGIVFIHYMKWVIGRARPHSVLKQGLEYSDWYQFGAHFVEDKGFYSSFPSGHTAAAFILICISYLLIADPFANWKTKTLGVLWGVSTLGYAVIMGVARAMAKAHWVSDTLGSICIVWFCAHVFYHWVFRVPEQRYYYQQCQKHPKLPSYWELRLTGHWVMMGLGAVLILLSLRAALQPERSWLMLALLPGVLLIHFFGKRSKLLYHTFLFKYQLAEFVPPKKEKKTK